MLWIHYIMSFRAKVCGRSSFVFCKCQMRPKIRACEKFFSPLTEICQNTSPAFQPNRIYVYQDLSKRWHIRASQYLPWLAWPWLLPEGQVHALSKLHIPPGTASIPPLLQAVDNGRCISWAELRLRIHSSPAGLSGFSHHKSFVFSQDLSTWKKEELSILALTFFKSSGSTWFMAFESVTPDSFSYCSVFSCFFLKGPEKLTRKHNCEIKPVKSAGLRHYQKANKMKKITYYLYIWWFYVNPITFQYISKNLLKLGMGHIGALKLWVVSKSLEHISTPMRSPSNATATFSLLKCNSKVSSCGNECRSWSDPWSC